MKNLIAGREEDPDDLAHISDRELKYKETIDRLAKEYSSIGEMKKHKNGKIIFFAQIKIIFEKKIVKMTRRLVVVPELNGRSVSSHFKLPLGEGYSNLGPYGIS